ncbi:uncharacterized protein LOC124124246 isoform X2 [Haliotis rufescens]|uniref:uncharacterized protein LOC124124246 isoform X2 n=1 Tax=Haliotis rufescens TaxID=6454 RepID=UPI001EB0340A|nr:uncharacterized protein LOC124124246 isoform X2 [Haliotis rufescens]
MLKRSGWTTRVKQGKKKLKEGGRQRELVGGLHRPASLKSNSGLYHSYLPARFKVVRVALKVKNMKTLPQQLQFFQRLFKPCRILPYDGAFVPPTYMYSESVMSADDVPQVDAVSHVKATKTLSDKDTILNIEREKLNVL